jgi:hypothetical protein
MFRQQGHQQIVNAERHGVFSVRKVNLSEPASVQRHR